MYIGKTWVKTNVYPTLNAANFYDDKDYQRCRDIILERINRWVERNEELINTLTKAYASEYAIRQIAYHDCSISPYISKIQALGRRAYRYQLTEAVKEAIANEYQSLPAFARESFTLEDYAKNYVDKIMEKDESKINKECSFLVYQECRKIMSRVI